jgi:asparagine synthetase B (glutamine-hydrolysing)
MCGILLVAEGSPVDAPPPGGARVAAGAAVEPDAEVPAEFVPGMRRRGPDHLGALGAPLPGGGTLLLASSLLQLRGAEPVRTPLAAPGGGVLCFNGQVFGGLDVPPGANDGQLLLDALEAAAPAGERGGGGP